MSDILNKILDVKAEEVRIAKQQRDLASLAGVGGLFLQPIAETVAAIEAGWAERLGEHAIAVSFDLYRRLDDDTPLIGLAGHEKALAQLSAYIDNKRLLTRVFASNTAGLAGIAAESEPGWGAVGPAGLGSAYGLRVAERALEAPTQLVTRFVLLQRKSA